MTDIKRVLDALIIIILAAGVAYAAYVALFVFNITNAQFVLFGDALEIAKDQLLFRRLYAIESYLAGIALILYLAFRKQLWKFK